MRTEKTIRTAFVIAAFMIAGGAQAANMWDGGGADGNWLTTTNWDNNLNPAAYVAVTFNTLVIGQTNTFLGGGRFLNQLIFDANADSNIGIELATAAGGTGAANLYLYGTDAGGAPKITVDSNATANIRIFGAPAASVVGLGVRAGNTASGNLTIDHNGSGNLSIEKGISGAGYSVTKTGTGTLTLANSGNASTYNNFTLNDGRVRIGGAQVATALGTNTVYLNGGTLSSDGATARSTAQALVFGGNVKLGHATDNGALTLDGTANLGGATNTITADSAVTLGGVISNGGLTKDGTGILTLSGVNTYAGNTTVSNGTLTLADNAGLTFVIGANGVNNKIRGAGAVILDGDFYFDLTSAGTTAGDSWTIVDVSSLTETFGPTFTINGFTNAGGGKWTKDIIAGTSSYEFSQSTGVLKVNSSIVKKLKLMLVN